MVRITYPKQVAELQLGRSTVENFDTSGNGEISTAEAVTQIYAQELEINSLEGIENFVNVTYLQCNNNLLTSLYISKNVKLIYLSCYSNQLTYLECNDNLLTSLDISNNIELSDLSCYNNPNLYTIYGWEGFNESNFTYLNKDTQATYVVKP